VEGFKPMGPGAIVVRAPGAIATRDDRLGR
jgi:hypothetical protein